MYLQTLVFQNVLPFLYAQISKFVGMQMKSPLPNQFNGNNGSINWAGVTLFALTLCALAYQVIVSHKNYKALKASDEEHEKINVEELKELKKRINAIERSVKM